MSKKILIVDDSLFMRKILKDMLSDKFEVVEAESGASAAKQIKKEKPNLILLDIIMREGAEEGVKVLKEACKHDPLLKIIMITAVGQDWMIEKCKKAGAIDYILKPFDQDKIISTVEKYI